MKRFIYIFFMGMLCALSSMGQPFNVILDSAQQGNVIVQARNSITMATGYSYTPAGGTFLAQIVNPVITGFTSYGAAIDQSSYSINTSLAVGTTSGNLQVSGMANYTVPLDLPKGSAGLQPSINMNYTSTFNDGLLGIGWNLGGLSAINRVGQNLYFETQTQPVKGDLNDKYELDGKRLIVSNGYTYGANGSVYGTETEEFSMVTAMGETGSGPASFEVFTKSGLICEYGNTSDSKIIRDGICVLTWKINKITDRYGNYITFTYFESDDERPILQILYAGTTSTFAEINFRYKQRSDISTYVYGGKEFTRDILLDNIEVKNNGQSYKKYELKYMLDNYAQLQKITEYSSQNQPLNPLVFTYTDQIDQISQATHYSSPVRERFFHGDFNGDGRTDFVTIPAWKIFSTSDKWKLYLADINGNMQYTAEGNLDSSFKNFIASDMNGDGLTDLIRINNGTLAFYQSTGSSFTVNPSFGSISETDRIEIINYNGDGKHEILVINSNSSYYGVHSYTGGPYVISGQINSFGTAPYGYRDNGESTKITDFNGDGCSDILTLFSNGFKLFEFKGANNSLIETSNGSNPNNSHLLAFGDYNGDGTTDMILTQPHSTGNWWFVNFVNNTFQLQQIYGFSAINTYIENNQFYSADVNGDGKMDIVILGNGTNTENSKTRINVAINKGNGYEYNIIEYTSQLEFTMGLYFGSTPPVKWETYYSTFFFYFADYNGDGCDEIFYRDPETLDSRRFSFATGTPGNLLRHIVDGFGTRTQITYDPMSNAAIYTRGVGAQYPLCDFSSGMQLVSKIDSEDDIGGLFTTTYKYEGAKIHLKGRGFLGFAKTTQTNEDTGIFTENNYLFETPYYYPKLLTSYTRQGNASSYTPISTLVNTWDLSTYNESNRIFPYISSSTQTDNLKGLSVTSSVVYPMSNLYGNPTSVTRSNSSGPAETTSFLYANELTDDWLIGRPTTITKTSTSGSDTQIYVINRSYSSTNNSPDIEQHNSGDESYWQFNRDYDAFGNLAAEHKATSGLTDTQTTYLYDSNGVNLIKVTDQVGNETFYTWTPTTGMLNTRTEPFGNIVTYNYNTSDQLSSIVPSTGISTTITSTFNVSGGPTNARYYVDKTGNDGSQTKVWHDKLGRDLRTETKKYGGALVKVDKQYKTNGELEQYSEPTTGTPSSWNIVGYDNFGQVISNDPYYGPTTTYSYPYGDPTATRTVNGRNYKTTINAAGLVTSTEDPGGTITNTYWPNGLLKSTLAPGGITTNMTYDRNGNRLSINDPSAGTITNTWYGTGQPKTTANADGQTTTYTYTTDSKVQLQKTTSSEGDTNYSYYSNGLVNSITSPGGVTRTYIYELGKVNTVTEAIGGVSNLVTFEYDTKGRLFRKYFNGTSEYEQYDYDTNSGYLYRIQFTAEGLSTTTVWQLTNMDQYQRITQANIGTTGSTWVYDTNNLLWANYATDVQGYSYSFDANTGNLVTRINTRQSKREDFEYDADNLDRLTSVSGPSALSLTYTTNKNGNIQAKSDAGTYTYNNTPYAVDQITGGLNISNDEQIIDYYSFEKVKKITEGTKTADFDYNADHQRIRMVLKDNGTETKSLYYFGNSCEREVVAGVTTQYLWIGGDAYSAVAVAKKVGTGSWTVYNIFRDHLGTITHLKNGTNPADEYSFDAWGRRRNATNWTYTLDANDKALFADRGFTAHEYLEDFKLYNMNGRLYDPVVGRFLSADPYVQDPGFTQSMNRYSYCLNNPLKYTDPSGNTWWSHFKGWMNENNIQIYAGINMSGNGFVPNARISGPNNINASIGYNVDSGLWGIGNTQDGFTNFYYPAYNYNTPEQIVGQSIAEARAKVADLGEFRQYNPDFFDRWSESDNFLSAMSYDAVDGISVTAQSLVLGPKAVHLNGEQVSGNDRTDAFINTVQWGLPATGMYGQYSKSGGKSLVNIVTSNPKFRLQIHQHSISPLKGSGAAGTMKPWHLNINKHHFIFNPMNWKYFYPWWPW